LIPGSADGGRRRRRATDPSAEPQADWRRARTSSMNLGPRCKPRAMGGLAVPLLAAWEEAYLRPSRVYLCPPSARSAAPVALPVAPAPQGGRVPRLTWVHSSATHCSSLAVCSARSLPTPVACLPLALGARRTSVAAPTFAARETLLPTPARSLRFPVWRGLAALVLRRGPRRLLVGYRPPPVWRGLAALVLRHEPHRLLVGCRVLPAVLAGSACLGPGPRWP